MDVLVVTDPQEMVKLASREAKLPKAAKFYPLNKARDKRS